MSSTVVYQVTVKMEADTAVLQSDVLLRLIGDAVSAELRLPLVSPTRQVTALGKSTMDAYVNFKPATTEHFWFRCVGVGALSSVLVDLPDRGKAPTFYIREYVHSEESRWP